MLDLFVWLHSISGGPHAEVGEVRDNAVCFRLSEVEMEPQAFLPDKNDLDVEDIILNESSRHVVVVVRSCRCHGICPRCGKHSVRVHSWYERRLADLPWQGMSVLLTWRTRKFFCSAVDCLQKIFTERLPEVAAPYARRTQRLNLALRCIAFVCGGECGSRLAKRLEMPVSSDLLLRDMHRESVPARPTPRVLGVDDWAFRKRQRYGTVLIDLERGTPVDLLPDREPETLANWLQEHPGVEIISRDRGDCYIKGATQGAPNAVQVADRFHLVKNVRDVLVRVFERYATRIRKVLREEPPTEDAEVSQATVEPADASISCADAKRRQLYETILQLHEQGMSGRSIARQLKINRGTVAKLIQSDGYPERNGRRYASTADPYVDYLRRRWNEGCRNIRQLSEELRQQGSRVSYYAIRRRISQWKDGAQSQSKPKLMWPLFSSQNLAWMLFKDELSVIEEKLKQAIFGTFPEIDDAWKLANRFLRLFDHNDDKSLTEWLNAATDASAPVEIKRFAKGIERDFNAVAAAIELPWSNGQTEGQVNRLKTLKRQMYGRGSFELLRIRFLMGV